MTGRVLCISASVVSRLYYAFRDGWFCADHDELLRFRSLVDRYAFFVDRSRAEQDGGFVQLIPSCVILNGSRVLCVERAASSERSELKSKWTTVFGGHVDEVDADISGHWGTILNGVTRELREELGLNLTSQQVEFAGLAIDPTNSTGRLHLGLIFRHESDLGHIQLADHLDLAEFNVSSRGVVRLLAPAEIQLRQGGFDPWSTLFLTSRPNGESSQPLCSDVRQCVELTA